MDLNEADQAADRLLTQIPMEKREALYAFDLSTWASLLEEQSTLDTALRGWIEANMDRANELP
jgi:hypothetical protein